MGRQKTPERRLQVHLRRERVEKIHIQFIRHLAALRQRFHRNKSPGRTRPIHKAFDLRRGQNPPRRVDSDAVVRGEEVEKRGFRRGRFQRGRPAVQRRGVTRAQSVKNERRQREIVNHVRFVPPVSEIRDVVGVRHIRLGHDHRSRRRTLGQRPPRPHQRVGLRQVDAGRSRLLPDEPDRIESNESRPLPEVE